MKRQTPSILICAIFLLSQLAYAMGLSTTFGKVSVDNIPIGQTYSMEKDANTPFVIENTSDIELVLKIDVIAPKESELVEGYEPIPDTAWIALEKENLILPPESKVSTDVIITIPNDERYRGKRYQVYLWSHTIGGAIGIGLKSKLLIAIAE